MIPVKKDFNDITEVILSVKMEAKRDIAIITKPPIWSKSLTYAAF